MNKKYSLLRFVFMLCFCLFPIPYVLSPVYAMGSAPPTQEVEIIERIATQTEEVRPIEEYESKIVLDIPWGRQGEPGKLGTKIIEGMGVSPERMVVDDQGNIYIFDQVNNKINKYNKNGRFVRGYPVDSFKLIPADTTKLGDMPKIIMNDEDMGLDDQGNISVINEKTGKIRKLDKEGKVIGEAAAKDFTIWSGRLFPANSLKGGYKLKSGRIIKIEEGATEPSYIRVVDEKGNLIEKLEGKITRIGYVDILDENGDLVKKVEIKVPYELLAARFIGADSDGNIYIYVQKRIDEMARRLVGPNRFWERKRFGQFIYKYNSEGSLLAEIMLSKDTKGYSPMIQKGLFLDKNGNFYLLVMCGGLFFTPYNDPSAQYKVIKWEKKT